MEVLKLTLCLVVFLFLGGLVGHPLVPVEIKGQDSIGLAVDIHYRTWNFPKAQGVENK
jgi:hypothetical protein